MKVRPSAETQASRVGRTRPRQARGVRMRRWGIGAHRLLSVSLATVLLILVNLLAFRLEINWWAPERGAKLSQRAQTMMASTQGEVAVTVLMPRSHVAYEPLRQLLDNMRHAAQQAGGARMMIESVDPHRDLARAAQLARRYGVTGWAVVFECRGRVEKVGLEEMIETVEPMAGDVVATAPRRTRFRGEQLCVTALARLARPKTPVIYALSGQGERDFENYDVLSGYTDLAREIRREGYVLRPLVLSETGVIPGDCDVLLIAGPRRPPITEVRAAIEAYLARGGRLLFLADRATELPHGWEGVMDRLGLKFANLTAVGARSLGGFNLTVDRFGPHPIARELEKNAVYFVNPQVIDVLAQGKAAAADRPRAEVVVAAPDGAWGETDPDRVPRRFDPQTDRQGLLPLVVAIELGAGLGADIGLRSMRAVVFGDSNFAINAVLAGGRTGNRDLLLNAINWLTESGLPSAPSLVAEGNVLQLGMSRRRQIRFFVHSVVYWPLLSAVFGWICVSIRRR
jgi:hypothetical protein